MNKEIVVDLDGIGQLDIAAITELINEKWENVQKQRRDVVDTQKIAALTTFYIAKELLELKGLQENISETYTRKINKLIKQIDETNVLN
ncbi:MAG: cell division protein ZapA [Elusimicrobiota bacterium]|nr:cell division protein ZapA [Elusimicrobiota bacterium]